MPTVDFSEVPKHLSTRTHEAMQPVLMKPEASGPAIHYYMIRGGSQQRNITVWEIGTVGSEYIKTFGHYHVTDMIEHYEVAYGEGFFLIQKIAEGGDPTQLVDFRVIPCKAGDKVDIPPFYGHVGVNTGTTYMVTADDSPVNFGDADPSAHPSANDYSNVEKTRGFAYYLVERDGQPALLKNPVYKSIGKEDFAGLKVVPA